MIDYDITDKYGAIVFLKEMLRATTEQMTNSNSMFKALQLVNECLVKDINEIQAEIYKDFIGTIQNLVQSNNDIDKEDPDD